MSGDSRVLFASLASASAVAWWACRDSARLLDIPGLTLLALAYIALASLAVIATFFLAWPLLSRGARPCFRHVFFAVAGSAALLPGTALLLQRHSIWAIVPAAAVAWLIAIALRTHSEDPEPVHPRHISPLAPLAGALLQFTIALVAAHETRLAALTAIIGTWTLLAVPGAVPLLRRTRRCLEWRGMGRKWLLVYSNAFTLTCFALFPHVWGSRLPSVDLPETASAEEYRARANPNIPTDDDVHQGIIIYPEEQKHTVLVPPMPTVRSMASGRAADPLSIPFFGVYWVFRPPNHRPPPKSLVIRADPAKRHLHTNDGRSLNMEARQNFGTYFDPACCSALSVVAVNNDPQPDTVGIELFVRDSADSKAAPSFVGKHPLPAGKDVHLRFDLPSNLRRFDEVIINYKLAIWRRDRAPKVAIERFVFEPRGR